MLASPALAEKSLHQRLKEATVGITMGGEVGGTGFFVAPGRIVTAYHVIAQARDAGNELAAITAGDKRIAVKVLAVDPGHDIGLLETEPVEGRTVLPVADKPALVGEGVTVFGWALTYLPVLIHGNVALESQHMWLTDHSWFVRSQLIATGIKAPGLSGSVWVNGKGEVVGVQGGSVNDGDGKYTGLSFAAPHSAVKRLVETGKSAVTPTLGLRVDRLRTQSPKFLKRMSVKDGSPVVWMRRNGPGHKAGVELDDVIVAIDGKPVRGEAEVLDVVRGKAPGDTVELTLVRPERKKPRTVEVTLGQIR